MKKLLFILCVSTGIIFSCNSNKPSSTFSKRKGNSPSIGAPGTARKNGAASSDSTSMQASKTGIDSLMLYSTPQNRSLTNFQGSTGIGTGGSYASHAYRHDRLISKNTEVTERRKAYFKKRQFDEYYPQDMRTKGAIQDSSLVEFIPDSIPSDSTGMADDSTMTTSEQW